jgi:Flp pilus assembly protein TadG
MGNIDRKRFARGHRLSLVEVAVTTPVLALFAFAILQFGYIFFLENSMQNLSREAAHRVALGELTGSGSATNCADVPRQTAEALICDGLSVFGSNFTVQAIDPDETGDAVVVTVTLPMEDATLIGAFSSIVASGALTTGAVMRKN